MEKIGRPLHNFQGASIIALSYYREAMSVRNTFHRCPWMMMLFPTKSISRIPAWVPARMREMCVKISVFWREKEGRYLQSRWTPYLRFYGPHRDL